MTRAAYLSAASACRKARRERDAAQRTVDAAPNLSDYYSELAALNAQQLPTEPHGYSRPCAVDDLLVRRATRASLRRALEALRRAMPDADADAFARIGAPAPFLPISVAQRLVRCARADAWARFGGPPDREPSLIEQAASFAAVARPITPAPLTDQHALDAQQGPVGGDFLLPEKAA